jgi:6-phosphogluconolactonase
MLNVGKMKAEVVRTKNFVSDASAFIIERGREALAERGEFRIALSGGNTPRPVYAELAKSASALPPEKLVITFSDERCVSPDDKDSNFKMARDAWFAPGNVPDRSIIRMAGEKEPAVAAAEYEAILRDRAANEAGGIYRHDLILLGMGDDGHTASLFPGTAALDEKDRWVVANFVPKVNSWRLTFTFKLINAARHVCFLVNANKQPALIEQILAGDIRFPAARVQPQAGRLTWILGA